MEDNPYTLFVQSMRQEARRTQGQPWRLGQVAQIAPLQVRCGGILLKGKDLLVNAGLAAGVSRQVELSNLSGSFSAGCLCSEQTSGQRNVSAGQLTAKATAKDAGLAVGDQVLLLSLADDQQFILLCKVVEA